MFFKKSSITTFLICFIRFGVFVLLIFGRSIVLAQPCTVNIAPSAATICAGRSVNLVATGSGPGTTFTWSPATGLNTTTGNAVTASPSSTTTYTVTYACPGGVDAVDSVTVSVLPSVSGSLFDIGASSTPYFTNCVSGGSSAYTLTVDGLGSGNVTSYSLNWGDGSSPYLGSTPPSNLSHTYSNQGFFTIIYVLTTPNGCNDTVRQVVFNGSNPAIGMGNPGNTSGCAPYSITFPINNATSNPPGTTYTVTFNDGSPPQVFSHPPPASITHVFTTSSCGVTSPGTPSFNNSFSATIVAANPCGTSAATVAPIYISRPSVADFSINPVPGCVNQPVIFTNTSVAPLNVNSGTSTCDSLPRMTWSISPAGNWNVTSGSLGNSNGSISGSNNLGVNFTAPGIYSVKLVVRGNCGNDSITKQVCITGPPTAAMNALPSGNCVPVNVNTTNTSSTVYNCVPTVYDWNVLFTPGPCSINNGSYIYTNGTSDTSAAPSLQFQDAGNYFLVLTASNVCGTDTAGQLIQVGSAPVITIDTLLNACGATAFIPTASFNACNQVLTPATWTFPGGSPPTFNGQNPGTISYSLAGTNPITYTVTASASNQCGTGIDSAQFTLFPVPAPVAQASPTAVCLGDSTSLSVLQSSSYTSIQWSPSTGLNTTSGSPVSAAPTVNTTYVATVTNSYGCTGTNSVPVSINSLPVVQATAATICSGDNASISATGADSYQWSTGAAGSGITVSPSVSTVYTVTGTSSVTGCSASATATVTVLPLPAVTAGADSTVCNQPIPVNLPGIPAGGTWSGTAVYSGLFYPDSAGLGAWSLVYSFTDPSTGCQNSDTALYTVVNPAQAIAGADVFVCEGSPTVNLAGSPLGGNWSGAGVSSSGIFNPQTAGAYPLVYSYGGGSCLSHDTLLLTVYPLPVVTVSGNPSSTCVYGNPFTLNAQPAGGAWVGNGISGTIFDPALAGTGTWLLNYTYTDGNGCSASDNFNITVDPQPLVFAGNDTIICDLPVAVSLTGNYNNSGTWSGTGVTSNGVFTSPGPGSYTLVYTYTDGNGCSGEDSLQITVIPPLVAEAGPGATVCTSDPAFTLTGFLPGSGGSWTGPGIVNGSTGLFNPAVAAPSGGTVTLYYSYGQGNCYTVDSTNVLVQPLPTVIAGPDIDTCISVAAFTLNNPSPAGGLWSGPGILNPTSGFLDPGVAGTGNHSLVYAFTDPLTGCSNSDTLQFEVFPLPNPGFIIDTVLCVNVAYPILNTSTGAASWLWDFGNGTSSTVSNPVVTYTAPGLYSILQLVVSAGGCLDSIRTNVEVIEPPSPSFSISPDEGCGPLTVNISNNSFGDGLAYLWDFGNGSTDTLTNPLPQIYPPGLLNDTVYAISMNVSNLCGSLTLTDSVLVYPQPTSLFGTQVNSGCSPLSITFSNNSYGQPNSYSWSFGDGTISTDSLPSPHVYFAFNNDTTYYITLISTNQCGSDTLLDSITVYPNTVNAFFNTGPTSGCAPLTVSFTNFSSGGTIYAWDFGDGNVSGQYSTSHTYTVPGSYSVSFVVTNNCSFDTAFVQIDVWPQPSVSFSNSVDSACALDAIQFTNTSPDPLINLLWDFGDSSQSTLSNPIHNYALPGSYTVALAGTGAVYGCIDTAITTIFIHPKPEAGFDSLVVDGCQPLIVNFNNTSQGASFYNWSFGDGNTSVLFAPSHTYYTAGSFPVSLVAESNFGCIDTAYGNVTVRPKPISAFTISADSGCGTPWSVGFNNISTAGTGSVWDFGDGQSSSMNNPTHTYQQTGIFTVQLISTTSFGCSDTSQQPFQVYTAPVAAGAIVDPDGCAEFEAVFLNSSQNANQFLWIFGDGSSSPSFSPSHVYPNPGQYVVQLIAWGAGGCTDTITLPQQISVWSSPFADFSYSSSENPALYGLVTFQNGSTGAVAYSWDFDDGSISSDEHPEHRYESFDDYYVTLIATASNGCTDTLKKPLNLDFWGGLQVPNAFAPEAGSVGELHTLFLPAGRSIRNYRLEIYDTWGSLLWSSEALEEGRPSEGWDGKYNGVELPSDVYIWKINAVFTDGRPWIGQYRERGSPPRTTGTVTLIR